MIGILLCFAVGDSASIEFANEYWALDGEGKWVHTVKHVADRWGQPNHKIGQIAAGIAEAFYLGSRCPQCTCPQSISSRSDFQSALKRIPYICVTCRKKNETQRIAREAVQTNAINEARSRIWLRETNKTPPFDYYDLSYMDAICAFSLFIGSEFDDKTGEILLPTVPPFGPVPNDLWKTLERLHNVGVLQFGKKTPLNAFKPGDEEARFSYYFALVSWQFAVPKFCDSYASLPAEFAAVLDDGKGCGDYWEAISSIWWQVGRADALRYLKIELGKYGLSIEDGPKLLDAFNYALNKFSIPQVRNLIYRVVARAAAYSARIDVHKRQAVNSIPGNLTQLTDRAKANSWDIKPYIQKWDEEECLLITVLFDRVLGTGTAGFGKMNGADLSELLEPTAP